MLNLYLTNAKQVRAESPERSVILLAKCATRAALLAGYSGNVRRLMKFFRYKLS